VFKIYFKVVVLCTVVGDFDHRAQKRDRWAVNPVFVVYEHINIPQDVHIESPMILFCNELQIMGQL
jgi:hypothetical protein